MPTCLLLSEEWIPHTQSVRERTNFTGAVDTWSSIWYGTVELILDCNLGEEQSPSYYRCRHWSVGLINTRHKQARQRMIY